MTKEDIIKFLMDYINEEEMCVQPDDQTFDCCDCTLCRIAFEERVNRELKAH